MTNMIMSYLKAAWKTMEAKKECRRPSLRGLGEEDLVVPEERRRTRMV
jgi:hypothetical protein